MRWRRSGESALLHEWASVRRELDQQPLSRQAEFSSAFAQWVLGTQELPDDFLRALNGHFGWLDDFRTERLLGAPLAHALHEALDTRLRPPPIPPAVREFAAPLQSLAALRDQGHARWRLLWLILLLQPTLARHKDVLGTGWLQRMGLPALTQRWLDDQVKLAFWLRVGLASMLCWGAGLLIFGDAIIAAGHGVTWFTGTAFIMITGMLAGALISAGPALTTPTRRLALPLDRWRRHPSQPWLGLAWLLFAAWLGYLDMSPEASAAGGVLALLPAWAYDWVGWAFAIAGLLLAWPLDMVRGCVVLGLSPLVGYLSMAALGTWLPPSSCLLIGAVWMLTAAAVHEERLGLSESTPVRWLIRPMLNSLALADRWTYAMALLPLAVCTAWAVLNDGQVSPLRIFVVWVLSILATGWLQTKADAWGLRQLPAAQAESEAA